jgi:hypothetical protein
MSLQFYINNAIADPPENFAELEISLAFENNSPIATLSVTSFDFTGTNATIINNWIAAGLYGSPGITEGIPFQIRACNNVQIFDGVLDLCNENNYFDCDRCTIAIKSTTDIDWLTDKADSFTFSYLASDQVAVTTVNNPHISASDYIAIPYVINTIPQYTQAALISISTLLIETQIAYTTLELIDIASKLSLGLASTSATAGITSFQLVSYIFEFTYLLTYLILLIIAFVKMLLAFKDLLIQELKYKYGMRVQDLFTKACNYLGLSFFSTILQQSVYKDLVIIPQKYTIKDVGLIPSHRDNPDDILNAKSYGYFDGTFGDLIRAMNDVFNAKVIIKATTLNFEVFDEFNNVSTYVLPDIVLEPHQTNASELSGNYYLSFMTDSDELNTFDDAAATNAQCIFSQNVTQVQKNVLLKGLTSKNLIFSQAKRKEDYTVIENLIDGLSGLFTQLYNGVYASIDGIITIVNDILTFFGQSGINNTLPSYSPLQFQPRIGCLLLENDFIGVPKLLMATNNNNDNNNTNNQTVINQNNIAVPYEYVSFINNVYVNAEFLMKNYHSHSFWIDTTLGIHNQFYKYKDKEIPFCCTDYNQLVLCNWINTFDGRLAKVLKLNWTPEQEEARIDFDVKYQYTNNIKQKFIVDGVEV